MDPISGKPQVDSEAVNKLEQDLESLTQKAKAEGGQTPSPLVTPVVTTTPTSPPMPEALPPQPLPVVSQPEQKKKGSPLMIFAIILALLAVMAVVVYVFGLKFIGAQNTPIPTFSMIPTTVPLASPTETPSATSSGTPLATSMPLPTSTPSATMAP